MNDATKQLLPTLMADGVWRWNNEAQKFVKRRVRSIRYCDNGRIALELAEVDEQHALDDGGDVSGEG